MSAVSKEKPVYKIFTDEELTSIRNDSNNTNILEQYDNYAIVFALLDKCNDTTFSDRVKEMIKNIKENKTVSIIPPIGVNNHCQNEKNNIVTLLNDKTFISTIKELSKLVDQEKYKLDIQLIAQEHMHVSNASLQNQPKSQSQSSISSQQVEAKPKNLYQVFSECFSYTEVPQFVNKLYHNTGESFECDIHTKFDTNDSADKTQEETVVNTVLDFYKKLFQSK